MKKERTINMVKLFNQAMDQIEFIMNNPKYKSDASKSRRIIEVWNTIWRCASTNTSIPREKMLYDSINSMITYKTAEYAGSSEELVEYIKSIIITFVRDYELTI